MSEDQVAQLKQAYRHLNQVHDRRTGLDETATRMLNEADEALIRGEFEDGMHWLREVYLYLKG